MKLPKEFEYYLKKGVIRKSIQNKPRAKFLIKESEVSLEGLKEWPSPAPLTNSEIKKYIDISLLRLLRIMMIIDSSAWCLFDPETDKKNKQDILSNLKRVEKVILGKKIQK